MKITYKFCVLFLLLLLNLTSFGQIEKFKALFVFNIVKYIEWMPENKTGDFVIGVYGNDDIIEHLEAIAQKKKIGTQTIVIKKFKSLDELTKCQLLYITSSNSNDLPIIVTKFSNKNTLLVTDKKGMIKQGSYINFIDESGDLKFEISKTNIESAGFNVNSTLYTMGKVVE